MLNTCTSMEETLPNDSTTIWYAKHHEVSRQGDLHHSVATLARKPNTHKARGDGDFAPQQSVAQGFHSWIKTPSLSVSGAWCDDVLSTRSRALQKRTVFTQGLSYVLTSRVRFAIMNCLHTSNVLTTYHGSMTSTLSS